MTGLQQQQPRRQGEEAALEAARLRQAVLQAASLQRGLPALRGSLTRPLPGRAAAPRPGAASPLDEELSALIEGVVAGEARALRHRLQQEQQQGVQQREQGAETTPRAESPRHCPPASPPHRMLAAQRAAFPQPPECAFLRPGQHFEGQQRMAAYQAPGSSKHEHWEVAATVQHYDKDKGYIAGTMEARNVPEAVAPVTTWFEGEIIDNVNHTFYTADWDACADIDFQHWTKFPSFASLHSDVIRHGGRAPSLAAHTHIFMRWKEMFFVRGSECRLTIAGFYFVCMDRLTGQVHGYYFDPASSPDQRLDLSAARSGASGFAFPAYDLA